jgi:hypothetical protein
VGSLANFNRAPKENGNVGSLLHAMLTAAVLTSFSSIGASAMQNDEGPKSESVAFYKVPLRCPAAPHIGCGSRSKPILLDLESTPIVKQAWLDRQGITLAIVWKEGAAAADRTMVVVAIRTKHNLSADELTGAARDAALASFHSGGGWHRGADVDRLSEEEAGIIANRLVLRVTAKAPTASAKAELLQPIIASVVRDCLVESPDRSSARCRGTFTEDLVAVVGDHLSQPEIDSLKEATKAGFRPLAGER